MSREHLEEAFDKASIVDDLIEKVRQVEVLRQRFIKLPTSSTKRATNTHTDMYKTLKAEEKELEKLAGDLKYLIIETVSVRYVFQS